MPQVIKLGARLCGTGPHAHLPYMGRMGGRYPLSVPVVPGRSSTPSRGAAIIQRAGITSIAYFGFFLNNGILHLCRFSSVVEHLTCNEGVPGSNPGSGSSHSGNVTVNSLPFPSSLLNVMVPPKFSTIVLLM